MITRSRFCTALTTPGRAEKLARTSAASALVADLAFIITRHKTLRHRTAFRPAIINLPNHQAVPASHLNNVVIYIRIPRATLMFADGAGALDRRRRHEHPASVPAAVADPWSRGCSSTNSRSPGRQARRDALPRAQGQHPCSGVSLGDRIADGGLPAAARRWTSLFDKYGRETILAAIEQIFGRDRSQCRNRGVAARRPATSERRARRDGGLRGEPVPITPRSPSTRAR